MSAPLFSALTKRSGVVAGTNKNDRAWTIREVLAELVGIPSVIEVTENSDGLFCAKVRDGFSAVTE